MKRREMWVPTLRGWLLLVAAAMVMALGIVQGTVSFLSPNRPLGQGILVVEGWLPDYALREAKQVFEHGAYRVLLVTGVPIEEGLHISGEKDYAQLSAGALRAMGVNEESIVRVACPEVPRDRTYSTARKVREWLDANASSESVDVFTLGVHARRTWLLYGIALGELHPIGIISGHDRRYDVDGWWKTSSGFRTVTGEVIAYFYAKFWFSPHPAQTAVQ